MSSLQCPQCHHPIDQDFGVITCSKCGAVLMIDMDGHIKLGESQAVTPPVEKKVSEELTLPPSSSQATPTPSTAEEEPAPPPVSAPGPADFRDEILDYANQDMESGPLSYTLILTGIDNGQIRKNLQEILSDSKFKLNVELLMKSIHNGQMEIKNLNPVKASLLVQKVRRTALGISWRQHVFSDQ